MKRYYISIDQSTTSTKLFLIDNAGKICDQVSKKHRQIYPQNGWVEHDPLEIYENLMELMKCLLLKHHDIAQAIVAITITNQRETALLWDYEKAVPLYNAIVWQCRRTSELCLKYKEYENLVNQKTGLKIDPYFSATKWVWLLEHVDTMNKDVRLGTMDSWLLYKLSDDKIHACDHSNASRTLLYNLQTCTWDPELLEIFAIPQSMLPVIKESDAVFAHTTIHGLLEQSIPIIGVMGDSQAALYAQNCIHSGDVKITLGTGSSVLMNQGKSIVQANHGLVSTLAWKLKGGSTYASEAIINSCGDTLNWLRDELGIFQSDNELDSICIDELRDEQVMIIPAFHGMALPYWRNDCKASVHGISRNTNKRNLMCAGLCSIAYQIQDALQALQTNSGINIHNIMVDGGASKNKSLMQFLSDVSGCKIIVKKTSDLSALGAYKIALFELEHKSITWEEESQIYVASITDEKRRQLLTIWHQAIEKTL